MLPQVLKAQSTAGSCSEGRLWAEDLLERYCTLVGKHVASNAHNPAGLLSPRTTISASSILTPFRAWARFSDSGPDYGTRPRIRNEAVLSGRRVWQAYYDTVSLILQFLCQDTHRVGDCMNLFGFPSKASRNAELRSVEAVYEKLLFKEVSFPEANEASPEIESWTDQVMVNWAILTAPESLDEDLEKGGKAALSRRVQGVSGSLSACSL